MAKKIPVGRRGFLKGAAGAAAGAAALVGSAPAIKAQSGKSRYTATLRRIGSRRENVARA